MSTNVYEDMVCKQGKHDAYKSN